MWVGWGGKKGKDLCTLKEADRKRGGGVEEGEGE